MKKSENKSNHMVAEKESANYSPYNLIPGSKAEVLHIAYPIMISTMVQSLIGMTDTFFMGKVSTDAQAAVGMGMMIVWASICFFIGTLTSINTFVSQEYGAGKFKACAEVTIQSLYLCLIFYLFIPLLMMIFPYLIEFTNTDKSVMEIGKSYVGIRIALCIFPFIDTAIVSFLRGIGDTKTPMWVSFVVVILNIIFTYILVFGELGFNPMGAEGAAWGSVLATACGVIIYLFIFFGNKIDKKFKSRTLSWPSKKMKELLNIGLPIGISYLLEFAAWLFLTLFLTSEGKEIIAGHAIVIQVMHLSFMPGFGMSIAATTLVGQHLGAAKKWIARQSAYNAIKLVTIYMFVMGIIFCLFGTELSGIFTKDPDVLKVAAHIFFIAGIFQFFDGLQMSSAACLRGAGETAFPMKVNIFLSFALFIPSVYFLGKTMALSHLGAWIAALFYMISFAGILFVKFKAMTKNGFENKLEASK